MYVFIPDAELEKKVIAVVRIGIGVIFIKISHFEVETCCVLRNPCKKGCFRMDSKPP